jgi:repressor LexA
MSSSNPAELTERRQKILQVLRECLEVRGYPPSLREIADAVGLKTVSAVAYQLKILAEMGYVARDPRLARTVVEQSPRLRDIPGGACSPEMVSMPLFERIAAGTGVIADPEPVGTLQLPRNQVGSGKLFAVTVAGDSMVDANIFDGDVVIVRQQEVAHNGDIVAAMNGEEATVKTFQRTGGHVWLIPQNPRYDPIPGDGCRIMGKVVATLHRL